MTPPTTEILEETKRLRENCLSERSLNILAALDVAVKHIEQEIDLHRKIGLGCKSLKRTPAWLALAEMHRLMKGEG
jgi:hypothetical protein